MLLSQLFHTKCRFLTYGEGKVPVPGAGLGTDESHGAPHVVFASSEGPQVRVCTEGLAVVTGWDRNCHCSALLLPLVIQQLLLPRNLIPSLEKAT